MRPTTLAAIVPVSIELLKDAANAAQIIESALTSALSLKLDQAIMQGSGSESEPLGILNHDSVNTISSVGTRPIGRTSAQRSATSSRQITTAILSGWRGFTTRARARPTTV